MKSCQPIKRLKKKKEKKKKKKRKRRRRRKEECSYTFTVFTNCDFHEVPRPYS
jgi:hypothetical protein